MLTSRLFRPTTSLIRLPCSSFAQTAAWKPPTLKDSYDVLVLGGGTGGITFAKEAIAQGLSVGLLDFITPSPRGSKWGLGGTCMNVGCVPKKLMHLSGMIKHDLIVSPHYGWSVKGGELEKPVFAWETLRDNIQGYIKSANYATGVALKTIGIDYVNAKGVLVDPHTIRYRYKDDAKYPEKTVTAKNIVLAVGARPNMKYTGAGGEKPEEYWVTSDDLFTLEEEPGKTLVYGGGYIGVECAGFLCDLGYDVTLLSLAPYLAGFDGDMTRKVMDDLKSRGVKVYDASNIEGIRKLDDKTTEVKFSFNAPGGKPTSRTDTFKTLLLAVGRLPSTKNLGASEAGIKLSKSGHIVGRREEKERSESFGHVYAVGDAVFGCPQLMPVAQKSGYYLAKRMAARIKGTLDEKTILEEYSMDYNTIPTTLFTPTECASVGLTEDDAAWRYGYENVEVYHSALPSLEDYILPNKRMSYMKVITHKKEQEKVVGMHYFGAHAGEIITAFAVGMKRGITKRDLDFTVGVHPTVCEEFTNLRVKKREKPEFKKTAC